MNRALFLTALLACAAPAIASPALAQPAPAAMAPTGLSPDDQALVDRAVAYLEDLTSASGRFVQTDPRGATTQGVVLLQRPGKARFEYDPPSGLLVVADGRTVSVLDRRLKTFEAYPQGSTPLGMFLAGRIKLTGGVKVTRVTRLSDGFSLTAEDPRKQTRGSITLNFTDKPLALAGWTLVDARNAVTRVRLVDFKPASGLEAAQFVLRDPRPPVHAR